MTCFDQITRISNALLTPVLGIIGAWILVNQYRLLRSRWRLDLYDKRYPVFLSTMEYLSHITATRTTSSQEVFDFAHKTKSLEFLFGRDVKDHLDMLYKRALKLSTLTEELSPKLAGEDRTSLVDQKAELLKWFYDQFQVTSEVFGRYLRIDKK